MELVTRDGICFVSDLVWQKDNAENKISIRKIKKDFDFVLYTKTKAVELSYCFVPNNDEVCRILSEKNKVYSLTVFVLESLKEVFSGVIEDSFICFKIAENSFGVIFIYKGSVIAHDGEIIGIGGEIKDFILKNAYRYNILVAHVLGDVDPLLSGDFLSKNGIELIEHVSPKESAGLSASEYYLWQRDNRFNEALKKSTLQTLELLQNDQKRFIKKAGLIFLSILVIAFLDSIFQSHFFSKKRQIIPSIRKFNNQNFSTVPESSVMVPIENKRGVEIKLLLSECFSPLKETPKYLQIKSIDCDLNHLAVNFVVVNYDHEKALLRVRSLFPAEAFVSVVKESGDIFMIGVSNPLKLAKVPAPQLSHGSILTKVHLEKISLAHGIELSFESKIIVESVVEIAHPLIESYAKGMPLLSKFKIDSVKHKINIVTIVSPYSPFYLNKNHVLDNINVYNIFMRTNLDHRVVWVIKGEYSSD